MYHQATVSLYDEMMQKCEISNCNFFSLGLLETRTNQLLIPDDDGGGETHSYLFSFEHFELSSTMLSTVS